MKKIFKNFTPHKIVLNDGTIYESEGVARVSATFSEFSEGMCSQEFGEIIGLPFPKVVTCGACKGSGLAGCQVWEDPGTNCDKKIVVVYIVSAIVLAAAKAAGRTDCVAPASGHPDTIRNEEGHVVSVPGFVK